MEQTYASAIKLLDAIIDHQSKFNFILPWSDIVDSMKSKNAIPDETTGFYKQAFDKLVADEYFYVTKDGAYALSLEGLMFQGQGGYAGEIARIELNRNSYKALREGQRKLANRTFWLTAVIAIGTGIAAAYYIWSIYVFYCPKK